MSRTLSRPADAPAAAPVRILHLGAGNFFRAHQAWYTAAASDAADWGIAAFTGRSATVAEQLGGQDGLYTLCVQHADGDDNQVIGALSAVHPAADLAAWVDYFTRPELALVTSTVTEAGYHRTADGGLDLADDAVAADLAAIAGGDTGRVQTAPGRFVVGLRARRATGAGPLTFVPCDNVPGNGEMVARVVGDLVAALGDDGLAAWIGEHVGFVTTMVDRITPRATDADRARVADETGVDDPALVVTEPFSEWVLAGDFRAGRPAWHEAGAQIVDDVAPFEQRKLWMLNGSHSLMAYAATLLGHETVYDAIEDPIVQGWVEQWWNTAGPRLELGEAEVTRYREALLERYRNPRIRHLLAQIAGDGSQKLPIRAVPVIRAARAADADVSGATRLVAAWVLHLRGHGAPVQDAEETRVRALVDGDLPDACDRVLGFLGLDTDEVVRRTVRDQARELEGMAR